MKTHPLYLDHCYIVVTDKDFEILCKHDQFKSLFRRYYDSEVKTPTRSWHGLYAFMDGNYLEFFGSKKMNYALGKIGVAFSSTHFLDYKEYFESFQNSDLKENVICEDIKIVRKNTTQEVPWFKSIHMNPYHTECSIWSMFYEPEYLDATNVKHNQGNTDRESINGMFKAEKESELSHITRIAIRYLEKDKDYIQKHLDIYSQNLNCKIELIESHMTGFDEVELKLINPSLQFETVELDSVKIYKTDGKIIIKSKL